MIHEITQAIATQAAKDRVQLAIAKNPRCVVCDTIVETPEAALLIERNDRLACAGACTTTALRHLFVFAHTSRKGLRAIKRAS
jgi:hypothetical protein